MPPSARAIVAAAVLALSSLSGGRAGADGAFPDSMALFLPADRPHELVLATNFGLVISNDDGASWTLVCEAAIAPFVRAYQMSAPPADTLFAETATGLAYSDDDGCSWRVASGQTGGVNVLDVFPDPADASHVFAVTRTFSDVDGTHDQVVESHDGGRSFPGAPLFVAPLGTTVTGVEIARAAPRTLYLTMFAFPPLQPIIARSTAGAPFETIDHSGTIALDPYLAAVDAHDAATLYLRLRGTTDTLAISRDGGGSIAQSLAMAGTMSAFLQRTDGTLLVGSPNGPSLRSLDGGKTFAPWTDAPQVRALAERDGVLYVVGDDLRDDFAVARSSDGGTGWTPLLHFRDIRGPRACGELPATCAQAWEAVKARFHPVDAGAAGPVDAGVPAGPNGGGRGGCGCELGARGDGPATPLLVFAAVLVLLGWRRRAT